jgi:hypothetical protein
LIGLRDRYLSGLDASEVMIDYRFTQKAGPTTENILMKSAVGFDDALVNELTTYV